MKANNVTYSFKKIYDDCRKIKESLNYNIHELKEEDYIDLKMTAEGIVNICNNVVDKESLGDTFSYHLSNIINKVNPSTDTNVLTSLRNIEEKLNTFK